MADIDKRYMPIDGQSGNDDRQDAASFMAYVNARYKAIPDAERSKAFFTGCSTLQLFGVHTETPLEVAEKQKQSLIAYLQTHDFSGLTPQQAEMNRRELLTLAGYRF